MKKVLLNIKTSYEIGKLWKTMFFQSSILRLKSKLKKNIDLVQLKEHIGDKQF